MMANVSKLSYNTIEEAFEKYRGDLTFEKYGKTVHLRVDKPPVFLRVEKTPVLLRPPKNTLGVPVQTITFA